MSIRPLILLFIISACAGPSLHTAPANDSALNPSAAEAKRAPVGTTLGPADPLAAANCGLPTSPGACPEAAPEPEQKAPEPHQHHHGAAEPDAKVIDPNCKMSIDPKTAAGGTLTVDGKQYWFCSTSCRRAFEAKHPGAK